MNLWGVLGWAIVGLGTMHCGGESEGAGEDTATRCADGVDNDGDGHADCADQDCEVFVICAGDGDADADADGDTDADGDRDADKGAVVLSNTDFRQNVHGLVHALDVTTGAEVPERTVVLSELVDDLAAPKRLPDTGTPWSPAPATVRAVHPSRGDGSAYDRYLAGMDASMRQKVALTAAHLLGRGRVADMGMGSGAGTAALAALYPELESKVRAQ
jgi:hypothetical protein